MLTDYLYKVIHTEELIFVECESAEEVPDILAHWNIAMDEVEFQGLYTVEEADGLGYDTYSS